MPNERLERLCELLKAITDWPDEISTGDLNRHLDKTHREFNAACRSELPALASEWAEMEAKLKEYESSMTIQLVRELREQLAERDREIAKLKGETFDSQLKHSVSCLELYANNGKHSRCQCSCHTEQP